MSICRSFRKNFFLLILLLLLAHAVFVAIEFNKSQNVGKWMIALSLDNASVLKNFQRNAKQQGGEGGRGVRHLHDKPVQPNIKLRDLQKTNFTPFKCDLLNTEFKIGICAPLKVASTSMRSLFERMWGRPDYDRPIYHQPYYGPHLLHSGRELNWEPHNRTEWSFVNWTSAVVLRDPFEKLLSAFLHFMPKTTEWAREYTENPNRTEPIQFEEFVEMLEQEHIHHGQRMKRILNENHWRKHQHRWCQSLERFTHIICFENLYNDTRKVLTDVGAWNAFGASGWGKNKTESFLEINRSHHKTSARTKMSPYEHLRERVYALYPEDTKNYRIACSLRE